MKKLRIIILFALLFLPTKVLGYGINNYYINATVEKNGDLEVQEYFEMNGEYNGFERIIKYKNTGARSFNPDSSSYGGSVLHNGDSLEIEEVKSVDVDNNFDFSNVNGTTFKLVNYANKGDFGVYTEVDEYANDGKRVKIFLPSSKNKAFYIRYKIHNIAILHNDVAELGWNIFGTQMSESIGDLVAYINVKDNDNIKVWAHGPLNGKSEIINNNKVKISISGLSSYTAIDARITFDKDVIKDSNKKTNVNALNKIINYETELAEEANRRREESDKRYSQYIDQGFIDLEIKPRRSKYNEIENYISYLNESSKKIDYQKKLYTYQPKVDKYEYGVFKEWLKGKVSKENYKYAKEIIDNVFDYKLKEKMEKELDKYYSKLQLLDIRKELRLSLVSLGLLAIVLYVYYSPLKRKKKVDPFYFRDIPSDLSPAAAGILVDKKINKNEVSASILDLVRRKIIKVEKKDNGSYDFILNVKYDELTPIDQQLILLIFPTKNSTKVNSRNIPKVTFQKFNKYKSEIIDELEDKKLMKDYVPALDEVNGIVFEIGLIFCFTPLFPIGILLIIIYSIMRYHHNFYIWILKWLNLVVIILSTLLTSTIFHFSILVAIFSIVAISILLKRKPIILNIKYTEDGLKEYAKWHGLRNFLIDFSKIDDKEINDVVLWEKYLVYATALGVSKKVLKQIKLRIEQIDTDYTLLEDMMAINYASSSIDRISRGVVSQSLPTASFPIASALVSGASSGGSYSSGGGGGGGFSGGSSGGGSFGGGGGGGRF